MSKPSNKTSINSKLNNVSEQYKQSLEQFHQIITDSFVGITISESVDQITLTIEGQAITYNKKRTKSILNTVHNGDITSVLTNIYNDIKLKTKKDANKYLKIGITDEILLNTINIVQEKFNFYFKQIIKVLKPLITAPINEIWTTGNSKFPDNSLLLKDLQILSKTSKRSIIVTNSMFKLNVTNTFVTAIYDTKNVSNELKLTINEDILVRIKNTILFLNENDNIPIISKFITDFNKIKEEYLTIIGKLFSKYKMNYLMDQITFKNKLLIDSYDFNRNLLTINKNKEVLFISLKNNYNSVLDTVNSEVDNIVAELKRLCKNEKDRLKVVFQDYDSQCILGLVTEYSKKGITTYVDILFGDANLKKRNINYSNSSFYGKLSHLKKTIINQKFKNLIDSGFIEEHSLYASFGEYTGYIICSNFPTNKVMETCEQVVKSNNKTIYPNLSIMDFFIKMKNLADVSTFIQSTKILALKHDDIPLIISFIKNERDIYKTNEVLIINKFCEIIPPKYSPLFLLNSNLEKGVIAKTFKEISKKLKEGDGH